MADNFVITVDTNTNCDLSFDTVASIRDAAKADTQRRGTAGIAATAAAALPQTLDAPGGTAGDTAVDVTWSAPSRTDALVGYLVTVTATGGGAPTGVTGETTRWVAAGTTTLSFVGLTNGTGYKFKVTPVYGSLGTESDLSATKTPTV